MNYVKASVVKRELQITGVTLMRWKNEGLIRYKKLTNKKYLYDIDSVNQTELQSGYNTKNVIYARVSTSGQKTDLANQIEIIKGYMLSNGMKVDEIYQDIASGMNENRKQFGELLRAVFNREIDKVFITFKDRLSRFGFNYFNDIFTHFGTTIVVLDDKEETNKTYQQELIEDLLAIIHSYSMKLYTHRKKKLKKIEEIITESDDAGEN